MLTFAFCTYNRAERLDRLVAAMRAQQCALPFEILAVDNNSRDDTRAVLQRLAGLPGPALRWVHEPVQGIVAARNRVIEESLASDILVFIDDDELPQAGMLQAATSAILDEGAQCVGGRIRVDLREHAPPGWLDAHVLGFLGECNHGEQPFWITTEDTGVWSGNVAYEMAMFRADPGLRFDCRFDRRGAGVGGGEDIQMFRTLLSRRCRIRYRPDMVIWHAVESWKLTRSYFLRLHFQEGQRSGEFLLPEYPRTLLGVPPFLATQALVHLGRTARLAPGGGGRLLRQAMNFSHALGLIAGYARRAKPNATS